MHEFSLAQNIFDICIQSANKYSAKRIVDIFLEIGDFTLVIEDFLKQCFEIISKGSISEGANIHITKTPGILTCYDCGEQSEIWFQQDKKSDPDQLENLNKENDEIDNDLKKYQEQVSTIQSIKGYQYLGINLFRCKKCGSRNTELSGGKEIKIKNIKVMD